MLKTDLHLHTKEDPKDVIKYTAKDLLDVAGKRNYDVLALTLHGKVLYNPELVNYAKRRNILLIPGSEQFIRRKDVLVYNYDKQMTHLDQLSKARDEGALVIAPHPFYVAPQCLGKKLIQHIDDFDAIEYSHFYMRGFNRNKKAVKVANKYGKPLIGTSDLHNMKGFGHTYTMIDAEKNKEDVLEAIRQHKVQLITRPISIAYATKMTIITALRRPRKLIHI